MRRRIALLLACLGLLALPAVRAQAASPFTEVVAFSTKTGFRTVVTWQASSAVSGSVRWGTDPEKLDRTSALSPVAPDRAGVQIIDGLEPGRTYWYQVVDRVTGATSRTVPVRAGNAYKSWNGRTYTLNLLVQLDSPSLPDNPGGDLSLPELARAMDVAAERVFDATDGFARLGKVLVMDTTTDSPANVPFGYPGSPCAAGSAADILVETTLPFDSHTWTPWVIDDPCTSLYLGREGQLVLPWKNELHTGYVATHELLHYAFNAPDLYRANSSANCWNPKWDGSLMHNTGGWSVAQQRWLGTELDRNETLTPCDMGDEPYTWDLLRERYTNVPLRAAGPIGHVVDTKPVGNPDGGALEIFVLSRLPGGSKLARFTP